MLELRLTQHPARRGRHKVEIALDGDGARRTAASTFAFALSSRDVEDRPSSTTISARSTETPETSAARSRTIRNPSISRSRRAICTAPP